MKKVKKILLLLFCIITVAIITKLTIQIFDTAVYADVGSFEDYSSGSDFRRFFMGRLFEG